MQIHVHIHHHPDPTVRESLMAIAAEIQALIDQAKANATVEASADVAIKALLAQVSDLKNQIATLQAGALTPEDTAALTAAQQELAASAAALQVDIPPPAA